MVSAFHQQYVPGISRHDVIFATLAFTVPSRDCPLITRRIYKNLCLSDLLADLAPVNWHELYAPSDIDFKVKFFTGAMLKAYDDHAPYRSFTPRRPPSPWLTKDIQSLISAWNNAWSTYKRRLRLHDIDIFATLSRRPSRWRSITLLRRNFVAALTPQRCGK